MLSCSTPLHNIRDGIQFHGVGDKIVNMGELFANPRLYDVPMQRVLLSEVERKSFGLEIGDLLFARRSLVAEGAGKCSIVCQINEPITFESSIIRARPNTQIADSTFLYYVFQSRYGVYILDTIRRQVAVAGITGKDLVKLAIPLPPLKEQQSIAYILSTFDKKIELNRQINETLEAMARAIFKSWFVDFDPVRAIMEGREPYGMDAETASLFPNSFEVSPLGEIPKGWKIGTIGDVADNPRRGVTPNDINQNTPYIGLEHMPRNSITLGEWGLAQDVTSNKFRFYQGEILFGKLRPYFHKVGVAVQDGVCSTDILVIVPKYAEWYSFVLAHVSSDEFVQYTDGTSTGTKMPRTNWSDMKAYKIVLPPKNIAEHFNKIVQGMVEAIQSNIIQSHTLISIRDTLLPKLLSGELRVKEADKYAEAHL